MDFPQEIKPVCPIPQNPSEGGGEVGAVFSFSVSKKKEEDFFLLRLEKEWLTMKGWGGGIGEGGGQTHVQYYNRSRALEDR